MRPLKIDKLADAFARVGDIDCTHFHAWSVAAAGRTGPPVLINEGPRQPLAAEA
jgi:hypothetical protein